MRIYSKFLVPVFLVFASACTKEQPPVEQPAETEMIRTSTIKDIMDSLVDPSGDFIFESVQEIADEQGVRTVSPQTDEEWQEVKRRGIALVEAPNLLVMSDRKVALSGEKSENPEIELQPEQIQKLIDDDRPSFVKRARTLQDAAMLVVKAAESKDKDALFDAAGKIDRACENCHLQYWYPNDERAQEAAAAAEALEKK